MAKVLYICYYGLREPLVQTQVLPYLGELLKDEHDISLLTFEPNLGESWTQAQITDEQQRLRELGIDWHCLAYHKRFSALATAYDVFRGALLIRGMIRSKGLDVLHGRVHVPTLIGAIARKLSGRKPKLLFDIRGFFPEEYTDAGIWPADGILYRSTKKIEKWLLRESDGFVVLTEKARSILFPESKEAGFDRRGRPVEVIPCCVDLRKFPVPTAERRALLREELGVTDRKVAVYVGSFGGWYLTEEMLDFFSAARQYDPNTFVLILTQREKDKVVEKLRHRGFADDDFDVRSVEPSAVCRYLSAADISISFIKASYSKQSSSPTKIAEYLACGLPVLINSGIGDLDKMITGQRVGVLLTSFDQAGYLKALQQLKELGNVEEQCRKTASEEFDLERIGGKRYRRLYRRLFEGN